MRKQLQRIFQPINESSTYKFEVNNENNYLKNLNNFAALLRIQI